MRQSRERETAWVLEKSQLKAGLAAALEQGTAAQADLAQAKLDVRAWMDLASTAWTFLHALANAT